MPKPVPLGKFVRNGWKRRRWSASFMPRPLSLKVITPVGTPLPGERAVTVAVRVIAWSLRAGLALEASVTDVASCDTVWLMGLELLGPNPTSPG